VKAYPAGIDTDASSAIRASTQLARSTPRALTVECGSLKKGENGKMGKNIHRREFIAGSIGAGALAVGLGITPARLRAQEARPAPMDFPLPQPVVPLDVAAVRQTAYDRYFEGGCMFGAAAALVEGLREACRPAGGGGYTDWDLIPTGMFKYGSGGVAGWGTICGILNGAAAVLAMAGYNALISQVIGWYTIQSFPLASSDDLATSDGKFQALADIDVPAHTVADSPLCHISISKFCEAAGISVKDSLPESVSYKNDRCSKICADTAALSAELINAQLEGGSEDIYTTPESFASCLSCHGGSGMFDQVGQMNCLGCHSSSDVTLVGRTHGQKLPAVKGKKR